MNKDHYEVLGVNNNAPDEVIRAAYRALAKKYHPDRNPNNKNAEFKLKEINASFDVIGDVEKRKQYDKVIQDKVSSTPKPSEPEKNKTPESRQSTNDNEFEFRWNEKRCVNEWVKKESRSTGSATKPIKTQTQPTSLVETTIILVPIGLVIIAVVAMISVTESNSKSIPHNTTSTQAYTSAPAYTAPVATQEPSPPTTLQQFQEVLIKEGYYLGPKGADGVYGSYTQKAWHDCYLHNKCGQDAPQIDVVPSTSNVANKSIDKTPQSTNSESKSEESCGELAREAREGNQSKIHDYIEKCLGY